jgi:hypothetical protein
MACIEILKPNGQPDPRFNDLLELFDGNEAKALDAFVRESYFNERIFDYSVSGMPAITQKDFLNSFFVYDDHFSDVDAQNLRSRKEELVERKIVNGVPHYQMFDTHGNPKVFPESELNSRVEDHINEIKELQNTVLEKVFSIITFQDSAKIDLWTSKVKETFKNLDMAVIKKFLRGLNLKNIKLYADHAASPFFNDSLKDENILIHEANTNGVKSYDILMPSVTSGNRTKFNKGSDSWMNQAFNDKLLSKKKGLTIKNNNEGKKLLMATLIALNIKKADPDAKIRSVRFGNFSFQGEAYDLDLFQGISNLRSAYNSEESRKHLPGEIIKLIEDTMQIPDEAFLPSAVDILFAHEEKKKLRGEVYQKELVMVLEGDHAGKSIAAIDRRINQLIKYNDKNNANGKKKYEDPSDVIGQEVLILAKAREQLYQHGGLDRRTLNKGVRLGTVSKWFKSLSDFQNPQMQMVFNEYKSVMFAVKQKFLKAVKAKDKVFDEYLKAFENENGSSAKRYLLNNMQGLYENLFEKIQVRTYINGELSTDKVDADVMKFKDPDDTTNGLKEFERKFIRDTIELHKKSIVELIDKKILNGEIDAVTYQSGEDWYNQEFKATERLLPVMRKSSGTQNAEGNILGALKTSAMEASDFLEIGPDDFSKDRRISPYGSATNQRGGIHGKRERLLSLGFDNLNNELVLIDPAKNKLANKDVEQIMHSSMFQNFKFQFEPQLKAVLAAAKIILMQESYEADLDRSKEIDALTILFDNLVYGEKQKIEQFGIDVAAGLDATRKFVSTATLMFNYKSSLLTLFGSFVTLASNAVSARFGPDFLNGRDLFKAIRFSLTKSKMFGDIVDAFLFHDKTEQALVYSGKYKTNQQGKIQDHHKMMLHSLADRWTKGLLLVGQLMHEDLIDNFAYTQEGVLYYDWSKDKRNKVITDEVRKRNAEQEKDDIPYDDVLINTLTSIAAKIYGAMSDEDKGLIGTHSGTQFFGQFKSYIVARGQELVQTGFENQNIAWYQVDENGALKLTPYYQEGMVNTIVELYKETVRLKGKPISAWKNMRPEQKRNIGKLATDLSFFGIGLLMYGALSWDDDENESWKKKMRASSAFTYLQYAIADIAGIYNMQDYMDAVSPASFSFIERAVDAVFKFANTDFEGGTRSVVKLNGLGKSLMDFEKLLD